MKRSCRPIALAAALLATGGIRAAGAAGIEHPDVGTVAIGRGGAYAADPYDGLALQYNPAGFAAQGGLRLTVDAKLSRQALEFAPASGEPAVENGAAPFFAPGGVISYGMGRVGPLSGLTFALGGVGPSAIGKLSFPTTGAQRYALNSSDYFIAYYSGAVAASYSTWLSAGLTFQLAKGTAKFSQAVWSGNAPGTDPALDAVASVDVASGFIPTGVAGVTVRPLRRLAVGLSYRPRFRFEADGSLTTQLPPAAQALGAHQEGTATGFVVPFPDLIRLGVQYLVGERLHVEGDVVHERWSVLRTIDIQPQGITVVSDNFGVTKTLPDIILQKNFEDSWSFRAGADFVLLPRRLLIRGGYLHETSAIPSSTVSVDFGNWQRNAVSVGASIQVAGVILDLAYAHHFLDTQTVSNSQVVQVVTPCLDPGCTDTPPTVVGNGVYSGALDVFSLSVRVALDELRARP